MSYSDYDLVSTEDHELEYILRKYNKSTSELNKTMVRKLIFRFKDNMKYKPHHHKNLWAFIDNMEYPDFYFYF